MANILADHIFVCDTTGVLKEDFVVALDPLRIKAFIYTGIGTVTLKDNRTSALTVLTLTAAGPTISVEFGSKGFVFPHGLQITAITGGVLYVYIYN